MRIVTVGVLLGLLSALCYGASDFAAGVAARRSSALVVAVVAQPFGLLAAGVAVTLHPTGVPSGASLLWGAASGLGSGVGSVALYWGLARGPMSVVAPLSAVVSAAVPAGVGCAPR